MTPSKGVIAAPEGRLTAADTDAETHAIDASEEGFEFYEPERGLFDLDLGDLWRFRELLYFLFLRDIKIRYKQTALGAGWAILQPVLTMVVFTLIFGGLAKVSTDGSPYPIFSFAGLLPWNFFAHGVSRSSSSLVENAQLITKVYFPRLVLPIATALAPIVDFAIAFVILLAMMAWYRIAPTWRMATLPLFLGLAFGSSLSISLWLSAINVRYRDVRHAVPFLVQFGLFISPVAYPASAVREEWQLIYSLNPMVGVIEGFRWALLGNTSPNWTMVAISAAVVLVLLVTGLLYFKKMELTFADVI